MASTELGMPAMAGFAMGADRLFALIRGSGVVGDGLLFAREGFDGSWD
jgi:aspartyl/asparaginyl-tRNA synthetase